MKLIDAVYGKVDKFYTPAKGLKISPTLAMQQIEWMMACNDDESIDNRKLVDNGLVDDGEHCAIMSYLYQTRKDMVEKHGCQPSIYNQLIPLKWRS